MARFRFTRLLRSGAGVSPEPVTRALRLLFQVLLVVGGATAANAATASGAGLKERIESAAVETTFDTEGGHVRQIRVANDLVVFLVDKEDSSLVLAYDLAGTRRFRFAARIADSGYIHWVTVSDNGSTLIIRQMLESEWYEIRVFNVVGGERFSVQTASGLEPSPSGTRFCMLATEVSAQALDLFDAEGRRIRQLLPGSETWTCRFLDDDRLLVADGKDTLRLVDANTGTVLWVRSLEFRPDLHFITPLIEISQTQAFIVIYDRHHVVCLSDTYQELWRKKYVGYVTAVMIDAFSPSALLEVYESEARSGYVVTVSLADGEPLSSPVRLSRSQTMLYGGARFASFSHGFLMSPGPTVTTPGMVGPEFKGWTMFLRLDDESGPSPKPVVVSGTYVAAPSTKGRVRMIRMSESGSADLISVRKHD